MHLNCMYCRTGIKVCSIIIWVFCLHNFEFHPLGQNLQGWNRLFN
uniref:Uncharacterized protein n=1 Tax=Rhizophora mucronata TaxID=61149 RepID=A0A2P2N7A6_RHIMU